jgi:glycosyltransferase involved in cell wall biosynthesis
VRVLHVSPYFAPAFVYGGPPRSILGLCQGLQAQGVDVEVMTTTAGGTGELPAADREPRLYDGVPAWYFPLAEPRRLWNAPGLRRALAPALARFDLVHVHGLWHLPGWDAARLARRRGVPYVVSPRGMLEREALAIRGGRKAVAFRLIERRRLQAAACLHATSRREAETLEAARFGPPVVYAPNGVDLAALTSENPAPTLDRFGIGARRFVLFLGRIHPIKRLDLLAAAWRRLGDREATLVIAGPDEGEHRATLAGAFEGLDRVVWTGEVSGREKADLLSAASALVQCSDSESFGLSVAEAMAARTPVVVTRTCPWDEIEREGAGRWVTHDAAAIAGALDEILGDPALARAMGERGRALVEREYTWPATARTVARAYEAALTRRVTVAHAN